MNYLIWKTLLGGMIVLADWLKNSRFTAILTGAGMSTESGLPDFRSAGKGMWNHKDPRMLASTYALKHNRSEFFDFYRYRISMLHESRPHRGHVILADWEKRGLIHTIITQNVDGFHQAAGSNNVLELHGSLRKLRCQKCHQTHSSELYIDYRNVCTCGGFLRPSVVLFGESLPMETLDRAFIAAEKAELFIVLGSSLQVSPANQLPIEAKQNGAKLVIVNMEETEQDDIADLVIHNEKIGDFLQKVDQQVRG